MPEFLKITFIMIFTVFAVIGFIATVYFFADLFCDSIKVGDIIVKKMYYNNPFEKDLKYETVIEVKKSPKNKCYYFKSYTSYKDGIPKPYQSWYADEHTDSGKRFFSDDWVKVGSLDKDELIEMIQKKHKRDGKEEDKES